MNDKSAGKYVVEGARESRKYYLHHFSKFFVYWILKAASILGSLVIFLAPVFQKFEIEMAHQISDSRDTVLSKCFDDTDHKNGYASLLLFNILCVLFSVVGAALILLVSFLIREFILNIIFNFNGFLPPEILELEMHFLTGFAYAATDWTLYIFIPFFVLIVLFLVYALLVHQAGVFVARKNPNLTIGDICYNAFATMKVAGGKLFLINLLYFLELLTFAAVIIVPLVVFETLYPSLGLLEYDYQMFATIYVGAMVIVGVFVIPFLLTAYKVSIYRLMQDKAIAERMVVAYKKTKEDESQEFISLTPVEEDNGSITYINLDEKDDKRNKKEGKK